MIEITVDLAVCQNYGQCVFAAPEIFDLNDAGELVYQASADEAARSEVDAAVMACPVQAITVLA